MADVLKIALVLAAHVLNEAIRAGEALVNRCAARTDVAAPGSPRMPVSSDLAG